VRRKLDTVEIRIVSIESAIDCGKNARKIYKISQSCGCQSTIFGRNREIQQVRNEGLGGATRQSVGAGNEDDKVAVRPRVRRSG
jgi:hypothetical protein